MTIALILAIVAALVVGVAVAWFNEWPAAGVAAGIVAAIVVGAAAWCVGLGYSNPRDLTCHVDNTDRAGKNASDMRVYTSDCGVLKVQDLVWGRQFNSADIYASIHSGRTYRFHVTGIRLAVFSVFPNVRSVQEVS